MHGFNQGLEGTKEIIHKLCPDVIALQEHWLTPANLHVLSEVSSDYFFCGSSSMSKVWHYPTLAPGGGWLFFALKYGVSVFVRQLCQLCRPHQKNPL